MTVAERVRRTQRLLKLVHGGSAAIWSIAAVFGFLLAGAVLGAMTQLSPWLEASIRWLAIAGGFAVLAALVRRAGPVWSFEQVALWIEEHAPQLRYSLVTAVDPAHAASMDSAVQPLVANVDIRAMVQGTAARSVLPAMLALAATVSAYAAIPAEWKERINVPIVLGRNDVAPVVVPNRLVPLSARVTAPAYSGRRTIQLSEPSTITGLQGSNVMLSGRGDPGGIKVTVTPTGGTKRSLPVASSADGWSVAFTMSDTMPALLRMTDRRYSRLVVTDPRVDEEPSAILRVPVHDTTLRVVGGALELAADVSDEVGLGRTRFEYIISSGSGESFTFREGTLAERDFDGALRGRITASVAFTTFNLGEGDRLSVRAVAWDRNTLTGPGKGTSETRTIRVARRTEYDSLSINRAPAGVDTTMMSLRMLIVATERLQADRPKLDRPVFVATARKLGGQGEGIRRKIQQIIDEVTGGGQIAADTLLTKALDAMWEATRELYVASPDAALPPMYVAYKALQALRNTKRYYIRGVLRPIIVNVERVRLTGTDTVTAIPRMPRLADRSNVEELRRAYAKAIRLLAVSPDSAMEALMLLRVASMRVSPSLSGSLGDAVAALQSRRDATPALLRARRWLEGSTTKLDSLPVWTGVW